MEENPIKLSEAIRLGSLLKPQAFGDYYEKDGTCALGAALDAVGRLGKGSSGNAHRAGKIWGWLRWKFQNSIRCPGCAQLVTFETVHELITHLNDKDRLSRETIAHGIEGMEAQITAQAIQRPAEVCEKNLRQLVAQFKGVWRPAKRKPKKAEVEDGHPVEVS